MKSSLLKKLSARKVHALVRQLVADPHTGIKIHKLRDDYPAGDLIPEHTKRNTDETDTKREIQAAYEYVDSVRETSDYYDEALWHEWALREAFLAGISYAQKQQEK